jgi:site-specific recombinase XerD
MSLSALAHLASSLFEAYLVAALEHRFLPCDRVEIHRVQKRAVLVENVTPHVLRHTCATWLMQRGVPLCEAAGYL